LHDVVDNLHLVEVVDAPCAALDIHFGEQHIEDDAVGDVDLAGLVAFEVLVDLDDLQPIRTDLGLLLALLVFCGLGDGRRILDVFLGIGMVVDLDARQELLQVEGGGLAHGTSVLGELLLDLHPGLLECLKHLARILQTSIVGWRTSLAVLDVVVSAGVEELLQKGNIFERGRFYWADDMVDNRPAIFILCVKIETLTLVLLAFTLA